MGMLLGTHCLNLPLFIIALISLSRPCFCSYGEGPFHFDLGRACLHRHPTTTMYRRLYSDISSKQNDLDPVSESMFELKYEDEIRSRLNNAPAPAGSTVVSVDDFGAKANGSDDSKAFKEAWQFACNSSQGAVMVVPRNKIYHLKPVDFSGPCNSPLILKIFGTIKATVHRSDYRRPRWLYFDNVQNLRVEGGGIINGNGRTWWQNSCKINTTLLTLLLPSVFSLAVKHQLIGSLGAENSSAYVSNVVVNRATLSGTTNGVRIKTWQGGSGYAKNIKFQNIMVHNVSNPIIIDQYYCDHHKSPCPKQASAVQVSNVVYKNIRGTSASNVALKFNCSQMYPCREIFLQNVAITSSQEDKEEHIAEASCSNIRLSYRGNVSPPC
ncbi:hypothetical protein V6N11_025032 [Hibiscus sabdariffa]|uniref:Polygalacturonase n=1 Tax=Hibiscus sabdariffa TaxID=183260 RepID=A0ABR2QNU7_9ROSI